MTILQSIILGIVQGITEFLPISSSAHLVLTPYLLDWQLDPTQAFIFDVLVQLGTLVGVIVFFWHDLTAIVVSVIKGLVLKTPFYDEKARLGWLIVLATIPASLIGLLLKDQLEEAFSSPRTTAISLIITAIILFIAERTGKSSRQLKDIHWKDAIWIGLAQAISIFPGISRSGATIASGMIQNLERRSAARFSFLMSIPVMLAAGILTLTDIPSISGVVSFLPILLIGFLTAAIVGYLSIKWLLTYLNKRPLTDFSIYCLVIGLSFLILTYVR